MCYTFFPSRGISHLMWVNTCSWLTDMPRYQDLGRPVGVCRDNNAKANRVSGTQGIEYHPLISKINAGAFAHLPSTYEK